MFGRSDSEDFQLKGYDIAAQAIAELKDTTYKLVFVGATSGEEERVKQPCYSNKALIAVN